jgi:hypothetical protein
MATPIILPAKRSANTHYSNFFLTVNTNVRPNDKAEALAVGGQLQAVGKQFFTLDVIEDMLRFKYGDKATQLRLVDRISVPSWSIELGRTNRGQRVHLHAFIKIVHHTWLVLDRPSIQQWFNEHLQALPDGEIYRGCYVNIRWIPASEEMALAYIVKQQRSNKGLGGKPGPFDRDTDPNYDGSQ